MFYLFWRSVAGSNASVGGVWALILGSLAASAHFFLGPLVEPGGFGLSRWISAFLDIVALPALVPVLIYLFLVGLRIITGTVDFANFSLVWLIPCAIIRTPGWSAQNDPILLVLVPVLWTSIAVGISFFIGIIQKSRWFVVIPASLGILAMPLAATSSYWAFFSQQSSLGYLFLFAAAAPMLLSMSLSYYDTI